MVRRTEHHRVYEQDRKGSLSQPHKTRSFDNMRWVALVLLFPVVASAQAIKLGEVNITPKKLTTFDAPLSPALQTEAAKNGNPKITTAKCAISVPENFDPSKSWPVVVVSAADDYPNIRLMNYFVTPGAE